MATISQICKTPSPFISLLIMVKHWCALLGKSKAGTKEQEATADWIYIFPYPSAHLIETTIARHHEISIVHVISCISPTQESSLHDQQTQESLAWLTNPRELLGMINQLKRALCMINKPKKALGMITLNGATTTTWTYQFSSYSRAYFGDKLMRSRTSSWFQNCCDGHNPKAISSSFF